MRENPTPPSSLDPSLRTPRARYNSRFISTLVKILESNPEADLSPHIKYSTERLNELRGMSMLLE
jgi:hypothetical protein